MDRTRRHPWRPRTGCRRWRSEERRVGKEWTRWTGDWSSDVCSSDLHRERIHNPGHDPRAGADVRGRDVDGRADQVENLRDVAARHALELAIRHCQWIARDATLGAPERDVDDGDRKSVV